MFVWHKENEITGNVPMLVRAVEMLELTIGAYSEAQELDDKNDFEILEFLFKLSNLLEEKMPKAWNGEEEVE
jgi:hypothetical protein